MQLQTPLCNLELQYLKSSATAVDSRTAIAKLIAVKNRGWISVQGLLNIIALELVKQLKRGGRAFCALGDDPVL